MTIDWKPPVWKRTTIDEDELERQRIKAILAKLPIEQDEQLEADEQLESDELDESN